MKIGLVRHFKVNHPFPEKVLLSKAELIKWFEDYDSTENIQYAPVDLAREEWKRCYSSTLSRTVNTARHIYDGEVVRMPQLQELNILHSLSNKIKFPFLIWGIIIRIKSFSSNKDMDAFKNGIVEFLDGIIANNESETLIVSHWFVMRVLRRELIKRGFRGDKFKSGEYGKLYVFEKPN